MDSADIVIVGGGVIGSAAAYFLMASPGFNGSVTVVERDPTYKTASTALSAGGIRQQFSNAENVRIGLFGHEFISNIADYLEVDGEVPEVGFFENGYLFLASAAGVSTLRENHQLQTAEGANIDWLDRDQLGARFPWLRVDDLAAGTHGIAREGWLDPYSLLQAFKKKARSLGATYMTDEVTGFDLADGKISVVKLASGDTISAGTVLNAAGPHAGKLAALAGVPLPVAPRKRCVFMFDCREDLDPKPPLTIDSTGVFFRPEGAGYICGVSPPADQDPDADDLEVDYHWFEDVVWPAIANRVPAFEAIKPGGAWAGFYDYNTLDQNAVVGFHPEISNLIFANGFSGHGLQQAPAMGRAVMELVTTGKFQAIDLSRFSFERIAEGRPIFEKNIV